MQVAQGAEELCMETGKIWDLFNISKKLLQKPHPAAMGWEAGYKWREKSITFTAFPSPALAACIVNPGSVPFLPAHLRARARTLCAS